MFNNKKIAVIIAAAGKGKRLGGPVPKQYLKIGGQQVILKTLQVFERLDAVDHIFIVASEDYAEHCENLVKEAGLSKVEEIVIGGSTRQESVYNALQVMNRRKPGISYVLVHDAARPFVSEQVIMDVIRATDEKGAAVACVAMKDSVRKSIKGGASESVDRSDYFSVQTPQGFRKSMLQEAYDKAFDDSFEGTDDASILEHSGYEVEMVEGDYGNIKITTKEDLPMENRVGSGFDVHRLVEGRKLILGGVEIPYEKGLDGHSDADVLVHAIMDALLGAAGLGDIGHHFPDTDDQYKGISSLELLRQVKELLDENFFKIGNVDATVIAQRPKIAGYIDEMKGQISQTLDLEKSRINIKGTTTEKLGFTGRGEGIAAEAVCTLYR